MAYKNAPKKKRKNRYRLDKVIIISIFVLLISFCAYMLNTPLEKVLEEEYGGKIITHDYSSSAAE